MPQYTFPNQRTVTIHRERAKSDFLGIKNENWMAASRDLGAHALRLYLYLASNADHYSLALSPAAIEQAIGMPRSTYRDQFRKLLNHHYLVDKGGNFFEFYERPYAQAVVNEQYEKEQAEKRDAARVLSFEEDESEYIETASLAQVEENKAQAVHRVDSAVSDVLCNDIEINNNKIEHNSSINTTAFASEIRRDGTKRADKIWPYAWPMFTDNPADEYTQEEARALEHSFNYRAN